LLLVLVTSGVGIIRQFILKFEGLSVHGYLTNYTTNRAYIYMIA
jgi:hypothetical protein